jgi:hypothetical protein
LQITNVGSSSAKIVEQNLSITKMRRMYVGVKIGCSASTIKCASYGKVSERARRWSCPSKHKIALHAGWHPNILILPFRPCACYSFEISQYITKHFALDAAAQKAAGEPGHGLKVAGSTGERRQEDGIGIVLTTDKDEETVRRERDEEAAAKRQQNLMPAWHLKSTISGDLTALGIKENAQSAAAAQVVSPTSLDESLKGLGKVVRTASLETRGAAEGVDDDDPRPDAKEGNEADCKSYISYPLPYHTKLP